MTCVELGMKEVGRYVSCSKSQTHKDAERCIIFAEALGQEGHTSAEDVMILDSVMPPTSDDMWCYMQHVLSFQDDF
jgi:hypothetical protein